MGCRGPWSGQGCFSCAVVSLEWHWSCGTLLFPGRVLVCPGSSETCLGGDVVVLVRRGPGCSIWRGPRRPVSMSSLSALVCRILLFSSGDHL